jgi:adenosylcobinamide-phosphate synthase
MTAAAVLVAAALDATVREPPLAVHPVRVTGRYLAAAERWLRPDPPARAIISGGVAWGIGAASAAALGLAVERWAANQSRRSVAAVVLGLGLWPLFSHRMLLDEVAGVEAALAESVEAGRTAVARIVSRDAFHLSEPQVRAAAIESLAENLSDSVVAPLLWFAIGGLPAAAIYRFANTADACWGYRAPQWLHAGWVAARADDVLNLLPARLTAALLADWTMPRTKLRLEARKTPSPNAGWPMAALALRLGVRLDKRGSYTLNPGGRAPEPGDAVAALRLARRRGWLMIGLAAMATGARSRLARRP